MQCSVKACSSQAARRVVVVARGMFAGHPVRVRLELPFFACAAHSHPGAFWAAVLRTVPRAFAALLGHFGVGVPWRHTRIRFVQVRQAPRRLVAARDDAREAPGGAAEPGIAPAREPPPSTAAGLAVASSSA